MIESAKQVRDLLDEGDLADIFNFLYHTISLAEFEKILRISIYQKIS